LSAIPSGQNALLVVPPSGFTVDVSYPSPSQVVPETLWIGITSFDSTDLVDLSAEIVRSDPLGAAAIVPAALALPIGSHSVHALVTDTLGKLRVASRSFAVREHSPAAPLAATQWIQLDFSADRDGDLLPDFPEDLAAFGLGSAAAPVESGIVHDWVVAETVARAQDYYSSPNPSGLPGGDPADLVLSDVAPGSGPFSRICVAGEDPSGGSTIGHVEYDPGNQNPSDVSCDDFAPSGVFPRELLFYSAQSAFQAAFAPMLLQPVGTNPLDATVLGPGYDPGDPDQLARFAIIETGVTTFAQALATIAAHEAGHSVGLVPPGAPGGGLFGGGSGASLSHNLTPSGEVPIENLLMNQGNSFQFRELVGTQGAPLPRLRELNFAYLRGRLVLDDDVTGIFPSPLVDMQPVTILKSGPFQVVIVVTGDFFLDPPQRIRLLGPVTHTLSPTSFVSETELRGTAIVPFLVVGSYAVEVTNPDGLTDVQLGVVTVSP
jgi:hypothetical protein